MANDEFYLGQRVKATIEYTDEDDVLTEPTLAHVTYVSPSGVAVHKDGDDAELVKVQDGEYYILIDADEGGTWYVRGWSTGTGQSATETTFTVLTPKSSEFGSEEI